MIPIRDHAARFRGLPLGTMAIWLALIVTIFLTRDRWEAWVVEQRLPLPETSHHVKVSPDRRRALLFGGMSTRGYFALLDVESATPVTVLEGDNIAPYAVAFSPAGERAAIVWNGGSYARTLRLVFPRVASSDTHLRSSTPLLVDATEGRFVIPLVGHEGWASYARFSQDGGRILTTSQKDMTARVWDAATGAELLVLGEREGHFKRPWLSPDGGRVVTADPGGTTRVYDVATGALVLQMREGGEPLSAVRFSPDGERILTASTDGTARVRDSHTGELVAVLKGHSGRLFSVRYCAGGSRVVTRSCSDDTWRIWDARSGEELERTSPDAFLVFSRDGRRIAAAPLKKRVSLNVFDAESGREIASLRVPEIDVVSMSFSPDGRRIMARDGATVKVWDIETGTSLSFPPFSDSNLHHHKPRGDFTPDGRRIVTWRYQEPAGIWDVETGVLLAKSPEAWSCAMLDDNALLLGSPLSPKIPKSPPIIFRRIRPEWWWGVFYLWHFWVIAGLTVALVVSIRRDQRALRRSAGHLS